MPGAAAWRLWAQGAGLESKAAGGCGSGCSGGGGGGGGGTCRNSGSAAAGAAARCACCWRCRCSKGCSASMGGCAAGLALGFLCFTCDASMTVSYAEVRKRLWQALCICQTRSTDELQDEKQAAEESGFGRYLLEGCRSSRSRLFSLVFWGSLLRGWNVLGLLSLLLGLPGRLH